MGWDFFRDGVSEEAVVAFFVGLMGFMLIFRCVRRRVRLRRIRGSFFEGLRRLEDAEDRLGKVSLRKVRRREEYWVSLSGGEFEEALAELFCGLGFGASLTPSTNDKGVDIWLELGEERAPVQCKRYGTPVGVGAARDLLGTMVAHEAQVGVLASVSGFTGGTVSFCEEQNIRLLDLYEILYYDLVVLRR